MSLDFKVPAPALKRAIERIAKVVERRITIPILANVLIEAASDGSLRVVGTDLDRWANVRLPAGAAEVASPGATTLPGLLLADIVKRADGDVRFREKDGLVTVGVGRSTFRLHCLPAGDFPDPPSTESNVGFEVGGKQLAGIAADLAFAISTEEGRYYLNGIHLHPNPAGGLVAVATDGHRLAKLALPGIAVASDAMPAVIVPRKTVGLFATIAASCDVDEAVAVAVTERQIRFATHDFELVSKLIDGIYPDYARAVPTANDKRVTVDRERLLAGVEKVATVVSERGRGVKFTFDGAGTLALDCQSNDVGFANDQIEADGEHEPISIGFNAAYVRDICNSFDSATICFEMDTPGAPAILSDPRDDSRLVVLMPMGI